MIGLLYLAAHLLADFVLQTDNMAVNKFDDSWVRLKHCGIHWIVYLCAGLLVGFSGTLILSVATIIAVLHFIIDTRRWAEPKENFENYPIWVDQTLHTVSIAMVLILLV